MLRLCLGLAAAALALGTVHPASAASTAGLFGEFWDAGSDDLDDLADALSIIGARQADATFVSTAVDYPNGAALLSDDTDTLAQFLGADAASLSGEADNTLDGNFILRLTGQITLDAGAHDFQVFSDDGFRLTVDGAVIDAFLGLRSFGTNGPQTVTLPGGPLDFELIFFDGNPISAGLELLVDQSIAGGALLSTPMPAVPLPAPALLLLTGLAGCAVLRRAGQS